MRTGPIAAAFVGGIVIGGSIAGWLMWPGPPADRSAAELMDVLMWSREPIGGPFALVDHTGRPRTDADFRGKLLLIYFGFTFCSDTCPTDLQAIAAAVDQLGARGSRVQPLFITIDPAKDTPSELARYVAMFHPRLIGLTGTPAAIRRVARDFKVYVSPTEPARKVDSPIDHAGVTYLMDAHGKYLGFFPPGTAAGQMIDAIRPQLAALPPQG